MEAGSWGYRKYRMLSIYNHNHPTCGRLRHLVIDGKSNGVRGGRGVVGLYKIPYTLYLHPIYLAIYHVGIKSGFS